MSPEPLPIRLHAALAEEAVLRRIRQRPEEPQFRRARDLLYLAPDEDREQAFEDFHARWFARLGLAQPLHAALAELPILATTCSRCLVTRAPTRREEGADLLVAAGAAGARERTVLVRLRPTAFDDPAALLRLLRAELRYVADMLDPDFGYDPSLRLADAGPSHEQLVRERYRALWQARVAGQLVRGGLAGAAERDDAYRAFAGTFPMLGGAAGSAFARFFSGAAHTHAELLAFAAHPAAPGADRALSAGARCPLCRFPTYAPEPAPDRLPAQVVASIVADFSNWRPGDGVCRQCADLYRARASCAPGAARPPPGPAPSDSAAANWRKHAHETDSV